MRKVCGGHRMACLARTLPVFGSSSWVTVSLTTWCEGSVGRTSCGLTGVFVDTLSARRCDPIVYVRLLFWAKNSVTGFSSSSVVALGMLWSLCHKTFPD